MRYSLRLHEEDIVQEDLENILDHSTVRLEGIVSYCDVYILADVAVGVCLDDLLDRRARVELLSGSHICDVVR